MRHLGAVRRNWVATVLAIVLLSTATIAKPMVTVANEAYDAGTIVEGSRERVTHRFKLKNTGDEPLKILRVRPG